MGLLKCYPSSKDRIYRAQLLSKSIQDQSDQWCLSVSCYTWSLLVGVITLTTFLYWQNNRHSVLEWEMRTGPGTALVSKCCWDLCWSHNTTANTAQGIIIVNQMVIKLPRQIASSSFFSSSIYLWFDIKTFFSIIHLISPVWLELIWLMMPTGELRQEGSCLTWLILKLLCL